jgi:hypothetical protein
MDEFVKVVPHAYLACVLCYRNRAYLVFILRSQMSKKKDICPRTVRLGPWFEQAGGWRFDLLLVRRTGLPSGEGAIVEVPIALVELLQMGYLVEVSACLSRCTSTWPCAVGAACHHDQAA